MCYHNSHTTEIKIIKVSKGSGFAKIHFDTSNTLKKYFHDTEFTLETDLDFSLIPDSILKVPFICNILPIIWLTDAKLIAGELDADFFESIPHIKTGYEQMYPMLSFNGTIQCEPTVNNIPHTGHSICLFSGGVDACATALRHLDQSMTLLSVWGSADYPLDDYDGWQTHYENLQEIAHSFHKPLSILKSNFYSFIDNWGSLNDLIRQTGESWWHGVQHGIGLISLATPIAFIKQASTTYIASSFTQGQTATCASDPSIDNQLRFFGTSVIHDGYELSRQDKIHIIVNQTIRGGYLPLHVCLRQYAKNNCCHCEKCYRTILAIMAEGGNPESLGFPLRDINLTRIISDIKYKLNIGYPQFYHDIQCAIKKNSDTITNKHLHEFSKYPIEKINTNFRKRIRRKIEYSRLHPFILKILSIFR